MSSPFLACSLANRLPLFHYWLRNFFLLEECCPWERYEPNFIVSTGSHIRKGERRREGERLKRAPASLSVHGKNNLDEKTVSSGAGPPWIQPVTAGKAHSESMRLA